VAFVRIHTFGLQLMLLLLLVGMPVLLPCNLGGTQVLDRHHELSWDIRWTMAHISQRSPILWVHALYCWVFTSITVALLLFHTDAMLKLRLKSLSAAWQDIAGYTVLVQVGSPRTPLKRKYRILADIFAGESGEPCCTGAGACGLPLPVIQLPG
jgi:hypothetical protein